MIFLLGIKLKREKNIRKKRKREDEDGCTPEYFMQGDTQALYPIPSRDSSLYDFYSYLGKQTHQ